MQETKTDFCPSLLISDATPAIRNAFYASFDSAIENVICCVHLYRNVRKVDKYKDKKQNKQLIRNDIYVVQSSPSQASFEPDFCDYFKRTWLQESTQNWYTGYSPFVPAQNNAQVILNNFFIFF